MTGIEVSVVVPTFNRRASVERLLDSLVRQSLSPTQFEVIVSIDGSDDGTREFVDGYSAPYSLRTIWRCNSGRAAACNAGAALARGELLIFLDDDMEATPMFIETHLKAHAGRADVALIGAAPIRTDGLRGSQLYIAAKFNEHLSRLASMQGDILLRNFYSGNFSVSHQVFSALGGFDEQFKIYGNEDVEFSVRLHRAGIAIRFSADAVAYQYNEKNYCSQAYDSFAKGATAVLLVSKHPDVISALRLRELNPKSRKLRALFRVAAFTQPNPFLLRWLVKGASLIETLPLKYRPSYYERSLTLFFWLGALDAIKNQHGTIEQFQAALRPKVHF